MSPLFFKFNINKKDELIRVPPHHYLHVIIYVHLVSSAQKSCAFLKYYIQGMKTKTISTTENEM